MGGVSYGPMKCAWCRGMGGWKEFGRSKFCPACSGAGSVLVALPPSACGNCGGKGSVAKFLQGFVSCPVCYGTGWGHLMNAAIYAASPQRPMELGNPRAREERRKGLKPWEKAMMGGLMALFALAIMIDSCYRMAQ
jgi:hypothetical protein